MFGSLMVSGGMQGNTSLETLRWAIASTMTANSDNHADRVIGVLVVLRMTRYDLRWVGDGPRRHGSLAQALHQHNARHPSEFFLLFLGVELPQPFPEAGKSHRAFQSNGLVED